MMRRRDSQVGRVGITLLWQNRQCVEHCISVVLRACAVNCLCTSALRVLRLGWNNLGERGGAAIADGLRACSTLRQLALPWSGIGDGGAAHVARALEDNCSIRLADLSGCQVRHRFCSKPCACTAVTVP